MNIIDFKRKKTRPAYNGRLGTVQHCTGDHFDVKNPSLNHLSLNEFGRVMSKICRFGGHTIDFYSVAQHSVLVAALSPNNMNAQKWALLHDANEALSIPDLPSPIKPFAKELVDFQSTFSDLISKKFILQSDEPLEVKYADLQALSLERIHCMSPSARPEDWGTLPDAPMGIEIDSLGPKEAFRLFSDASVRVFENEMPIDLSWLSQQPGFVISPELVLSQDTDAELDCGPMP